MTHTLPEFLLHWAERTPDAVFVTEPDRGRTRTYGQVAGSVGRFRARLRSLRVARGDRVAILAESSCVWVVAFLGTLAHGAIAVPLKTRHASGDLDRVLDGVDPGAVIGDPPYLARLAERHRRRLATATRSRADERSRADDARADSERSE
jgi:acyl-CoA synthetase (AMP-forming)/AMP-acid ligase II